MSRARLPNGLLAAVAAPAALLTLVAALGCGGSPTRSDVPVELRAIARCADELHGAVERAQAVESELEHVVFRARYNPAACACPVWEIELRGQWERVHLEPAESEGQVEIEGIEAEAARDLAAQEFRSYAIVGRVSGEGPVGASGLRYPVLLITSLDLEPAP